MQHTINPLFKTRQWQDSLLKWTGAVADYHTYFKNYWMGKVGSETAFEKALQDGIISNTSSNISLNSAVTALVDTLAAPIRSGNVGSFNSAGIAGAVSAINSSTKAGNIELVLYKKVGIGCGEGSGNPWLQELPDPVSRATWDNYVVISPAMAKSLLDIDIRNQGQEDAYEVHSAKKVLKIRVN